MKPYYLGVYEKSMPNSLALSEKLKEAKRLGFDYMEISIDETDEKLERLKWSKEQRYKLAMAMFDSDINIASMCLSGHRKYPLGSEDADIRARSLEIMSDAIDFASDLGIRIIQLAGYDEYYNPSNMKTEKYFRENLRICTEMAAKRGVVLAFETMETSFMDTVEKSMKYTSAINSPYLGIYPDLGNLTNAAKLYGHSVTEDISLGSGHIFAMHLKETVPGKYREIPFGTGHVDFESGIRAARDAGVRMFVGEFWYTGKEDYVELMSSAHSFLRKRLDKIFC